ncbi:MAG: hypothetical protein ACRDBL_04735 [Rhabdaerophilum sp.]
MPEEYPIDTAPRDRDIMLHGGGWVCGKTGEHIFRSAVAQWQIGYWIMPGVAAVDGYINPMRWSELPKKRGRR